MSNEPTILPTRVGHAEWGDNRFRGFSVARDLAGAESVTSLFALAIGGRRLREDERLMLDELATATNAADPRIWPLKMVRVVSAYGGCNAAMAALTLALEHAPIGHHAAGRGAELLVHLRDELLSGGAGHARIDAAFLEAKCRRVFGDKARPFGFGVPYRPRDERVELLTQRVAARGRGELAFWQLFLGVAEVFERIANVRPNMPLAMAAVCLDIGFTPPQIGPLMTAIGATAFWANAFEGAEQAPACLQTLSHGSVRYVGPAPRSSPRAAGARLR